MVDEEQKQAEIDLMKEMVDEIRTLRGRIDQLEQHNSILSKSIDDPETMMKKAGWLKVITPMADETYDPLQREMTDNVNTAFAGPFAGTGDTFRKSRHEELEEWKEAEREMTHS
tara:strand:+ start:146 stop:487 length:342 start_codon:yes stop_codon:yes gene_type:complete